MRFTHLDLIAYGPFSDTSIDLSAGHQGLHMIYGPNEAGKSAALRAVSGLLYGIPTRTADNFVHSHARLRIGAGLRHSDGRLLEIVRRKGSKHTLMDPAGGLLDDAALDDFRAYVPREVFLTMFGMDLQALVAGGKDLVAGQGEIGPTLFAAGAGIVHLRTLIDSLQAEADTLYKPRASRPHVNQLIRKYRDTRSRWMDCCLSPADWSEHHRELDRALEQRDAAEERRRELAAEKNRLERLRDAYPRLDELVALRRELEDLGPTAVLAPDFTARRVGIQQELARARAAVGRLETEAEAAGRRIGTAAVPEALIGAREAIRDLFRRSGEYRKAVEDLPRRRADRHRLREEAQVVLKKIDPARNLNSAEDLRLGMVQIQRIRELATRHGPLIEKEQASRRLLASIADEQAAVQDQLDRLAPPIDTGPWKEVLEGTRREGDLSARLSVHRPEMDQRRKQVESALSQLGLWQGTSDELERLPLPPEETFLRLEAEWSQAEARQERVTRDIEEARARSSKIDDRLRDLIAEGALPTEEDLSASRRHREAGWQAVRRAWLENRLDGPEIRSFAGQDPVTTPRRLARRYEQSVREADEIGDRLRRESERVVALAGLRSEQAALKHRLTELDRERRQAREAAAALQSRWQALWAPAGVDPWPPREMASWCQRCLRLREQVAELRTIEVEYARLVKLEERACQDLTAVLTACGDSAKGGPTTLRVLTASVEAVLEQADETRRRRATLKARRRELHDTRRAAESELQRVESERTEWRRVWAAAVTDLRLEADVRPLEVEAVLTATQDLFRCLDRAADMEGRIRALEADMTRFEEAMRAACRRLAPELAARPPGEAAENLHAILEKALEDDARKKQIQKQQRLQAKSLAGERQAVDEAAARLSDLCRQAGCREPEKLPAIEARAEHARALRDRIERLEGELAAQSAGAGLEAFIAEIRQVQADALPADIDSTSMRLSEIEDRLRELGESVGRERRVLESMDGRDEAARLAENAQSILADLRDGAERWALLRVAAVVLAEEIERYRRENQGPVVRRAGEIFSALTRGSFDGLAPDFDARDNPVLMGVRVDGARLAVEAMSEGTCDQLYLALRLAGLEEHLISREPLPLILDDILVNFDDDRAAAAFQILGELSARTQVIFFTHHRHLAEIAEKALPPSVLFTHRIAAGD